MKFPVGWLPVMSLLLVACSSQTENFERAEGELTKINDACHDGHPDLAKTLMEKAAQDDAVFRRVYEGATKDVADKSRINACGVILLDVTVRLGNLKKRSK